MIRSIAAVSLIVLSLVGCVTDVNKLDISLATKVCDTLSPISYDGKLDTQLTKDQVRSYNAKRAAFCKGTQTQGATKK